MATEQSIQCSKERDSAAGEGRLDSTNFCQYQPLDKEKRQIRLLKLHAGTSGSIRCDIVLFDLDDSYSEQPFWAVSYTWGPPRPTFDITVGGQRFSLRENVFRFLVNFCEKEPPRALANGHAPLLWIDSICIDQDNVLERNHQVGLMAEIYGRCETVLMWLNNEGQDDSSSEAARNFQIAMKPKHLANLLRNRYFSRLWIVQEVLLAREVLVLVRGGYWLRWTDMQTVFAQMSKRQVNKLSSVHSAAASLLSYGMGQGRPARTFLWCIRNFHESQCAEARDKVFGMAGLVTAFLDKWDVIVIDYQRTVYDVFMDVATRVFATRADSCLLYDYSAKDTDMLFVLGNSMGFDRQTVEGTLCFLELVLPNWTDAFADAGSRPPLVTAVGVQWRDHRTTPQPRSSTRMMFSSLTRKHSRRERQVEMAGSQPAFQREWNIVDEIEIFHLSPLTIEARLERWLSVVSDIKDALSASSLGSSEWFYVHWGSRRGGRKAPRWIEIFGLGPDKMWEILRKVATPASASASPVFPASIAKPGWQRGYEIW
ncbi:hypothetical protein E8E12_005038 [Didymella heteroderae]|uniref:Heterokaryon incompatibility domain-containing protein n=1 Tax=Didymella heteroderae TaxID=1769908 RepID=A0A9P5C295_9PLEO|nr:hypothetical protein E8E12_005038 [Didymella heteroderae]